MSEKHREDHPRSATGRDGNEPRLLRQLDNALANCDINDCWEWKLSLPATGYAYVRIGSKTDGTTRMASLHRFVYEQLVGKIPPTLQLDHLCKNRKCCNPDHLEPVTAKENVRRMHKPNLVKRECPYGHPYDSVLKNGERRCKRCAAANTKRQRDKRRAAAQC